MLRHYSARPVSYIRAHYEVPNNHVLQSILHRAIDVHYPRRLIGTLAGVGPLQLPSILASIGTLILLVVVAARFFNPAVALLSLAILCTSWWHLIYSHMLRAYSLSTFFNLLSLYLLQELLLRRRLWAAALLPFSLSIAHYLLPTNVLFTAALGLWGAALAAMQWKKARADLDGAKASRRRNGALAEAFSRQKLVLTILGAAFAVGGGLTLALYAPILGQLSAASATAGAGVVSPMRESIWVLGAGNGHRIFWFAFAALGAFFAVRRRRWRDRALLLLAYPALPFVFFGVRGIFLPARMYIDVLPMWAMLFGLGGYAVLLSARRALHLSSRGVRAATAALAAATIAVSAGELTAFYRWNKGVDLREIVLQAAPVLRAKDDFVLVFAYRETNDAAGIMSWEYYGASSTFLPYEHTQRLRDYDYLARRLYLVAAADEADARRALSESRVDRFLAKTLKEVSRVGTLMLYQVERNDAVLADYRAALLDKRTSQQARVEALIGLGVDAERSGNLRLAQRLLLEAKVLAPQDSKARFQLGHAFYLDGDPRALREFEWVLENNPRNVHARLYYGETLADQGRFEEASRQFQWYSGPLKTAESWLMKKRADEASAALLAGKARVARDLSSAEGCLTTARAYGEIGSYERSLFAFERLASLRPLTAEELETEGVVLLNLHRYAAAAAHLRRAVASGEASSARLFLAMALSARQQHPEARRITESLNRAYPRDQRIAAYLETIKRID